MFQSTILEIARNFPAKIREDIENIMSGLDYEPIWQTIEWQLMLQETGYSEKSFFIGIYDQEKLLSYVLLEKRSVGLGLFGFFAVGGPVFSIQSDRSLGLFSLTPDLPQEYCPSGSLSLEERGARENSLLSKAIQDLAKQEHAVFVNLEPMQKIQPLPSFSRGQYKNFLEKHTAIIDLKQDEETILSRMKQKGRYNIRIAEKAGVTVEQIEFSEENLDIFYNLLTETLERDQFAANSKSYFRAMLGYLEENKIGGLFFARRENEVIAAGIFVFSGKTALYYYGASSSDNGKRKHMATYLLQWEAIREAKKRGCEIYDFLGIAAPGDEKSHLAGVTDFKMKLTDEVWELPESQVLVVRKVAYLALRLRKTVKNVFFRG